MTNVNGLSLVSASQIGVAPTKNRLAPLRQLALHGYGRPRLDSQSSRQNGLPKIPKPILLTTYIGHWTCADDVWVTYGWFERGPIKNFHKIGQERGLDFSTTKIGQEDQVCEEPFL